MKQIITYITEKLHINKNTVTNVDPYDPDSWQDGDTIVFHGFRIQFFKIIKKRNKTFDLQNLGTKLVSGAYNSFKYEVIPAEIENGSEHIGKVLKNNRFSVTLKGGPKESPSKGVAELWDGNPVTGHGNIY